MPAPAMAVSLIAAVAAVFLLADGEASLIIQFLLGKFAYSTSNAASLVFLAYLVLALWAGRIRFGQAASLQGLWLMGGALLLGHGLNLWLTIRYLDAFHLPLGVHVYHWQGAANSFSGLLHSHLGKTAMAAATRVIGWSYPAYDTGQVFLAWVPAAVPWMILSAFFLGVMGALAGVPLIWRRHAGDPAAMAIYVLASLSCLKCVLDGGPLSHGVPPAVVALVWIALPPQRRDQYRKSIGGGALLLLAGYLGFWIYLSPERPVPALGSLFFPLALYAWLGLVLTGCSMIWRVPVLAFLVASLVLDAADNLAPYLNRLPVTCIAHKVDSAAGGVHTLSCAGESAFNLYKRLGDDPRKPQSVLIAERPLVGGNHVFKGALEVVETDAARVTQPRGSVWESIHLRPEQMPAELGFIALADLTLPPVFAFGQGNALTRNNYYVYLHQLSRALRQAGLSEFVMIPETASNPAF